MGKLRVLDFGEIHWAQKDGGPPRTSGAERPPGESGVSVLQVRFERAAQLSAVSRQHLIFLQTSPRVPMECKMGGRMLWHETSVGSLAICPAGIDCAAESADTASSVDILLLAVDPGRLSLAAAEDAALDARLDQRMSGNDPALLAIAHGLAAESASGYSGGPLYWSELTHRLLGRLVSGHTSTSDRTVRGRLGKQTLQKIRDYIVAHLTEQIEVDDLATLAGRSAFHFSRVFSRSVGMTPHRYVIHLRLQTALARIREGQASLAQIAADTGFSDQSHMSRWIRRAHGVAPSEIS
jgi:AraC family transcriptional regulator